MINNKTDFSKTLIRNNANIVAIKEAAYYFVVELKPIYDKCYDIMKEFDNDDNSVDLSNLNELEIVEHYKDLLNRMTDNRERLDEANAILKIKKEEFEILKSGFNGFD